MYNNINHNNLAKLSQYTEILIIFARVFPASNLLLNPLYLEKHPSFDGFVSDTDNTFTKVTLNDYFVARLDKAEYVSVKLHEYQISD